MRNAIKHPILTSARRCCDQRLPQHNPPASRVSVKTASRAAGSTLNATQSSPDKLRKARFLPPTCLIQPFHLSFEGLHGPINKLESCDVNAPKFKSFTPSHPPATMDKGSFVSVSTCLALHAPRCFVALCAHLFKGLPFSLHLSLSLSPSLPLAPLPAFPTGDLFFFLLIH